MGAVTIGGEEGHILDGQCSLEEEEVGAEVDLVRAKLSLTIHMVQI